ncbi:TPA: hypothetical protein O7X39_002181 [Salmonella enterica]|nr:hypothetical protein [Salmonella enterica]
MFMNSGGFIVVILCLYVIPAVMVGLLLFFLLQFARGRATGKAALIMLGMLLVTAIIFANLSTNKVEITPELRDSIRNIDDFKFSEFTPEKLPDLDRIFKSKSQPQQYDAYLQAIYNNDSPKELYQYFVQQLGSPLKNRQGSWDYSSNKSESYDIPFFQAIQAKNLTALQVFIDAIQNGSPEERKQAKDIVDAVPSDWLELRLVFYPQVSRHIASDSELKQADLILSAFPELAITKEGVSIIDLTILSADVRAMKLFAKYSHPSSAALTAAGYVLTGETNKIIDVLHVQPSLLNEEIATREYYSSVTLLSYITRFGKEDVVRKVYSMISRQDGELYNNSDTILFHATERIHDKLSKGSKENEQESVAIFSFILNSLAHESVNISNEQLWEIVTEKFYIDNLYYGPKVERFNDEAIKAICTSPFGPQFLHYVNNLDKPDNDHKIKISIAAIRRNCQ